MCTAGQRRAAVTALDLTLPGADELKAQILDKAIKAQNLLSRGADVNKHDLITLVVADLVTSGQIWDYLDLNTGEFTVRTQEGEEYTRNIFDDLVNNKKIY
jgi:class 3 adenylate cyclase